MRLFLLLHRPIPFFKKHLYMVCTHTTIKGDFQESVTFYLTEPRSLLFLLIHSICQAVSVSHLTTGALGLQMYPHSLSGLYSKSFYSLSQAPFLVSFYDQVIFLWNGWIYHILFIRRGTFPLFTWDECSHKSFCVNICLQFSW